MNDGEDGTEGHLNYDEEQHAIEILHTGLASLNLQKNQSHKQANELQRRQKHETRIKSMEITRNYSQLPKIRYWSLDHIKQCVQIFVGRCSSCKLVATIFRNFQTHESVASSRGQPGNATIYSRWQCHSREIRYTTNTHIGVQYAKQTYEYYVEISVCNINLHRCSYQRLHQTHSCQSRLTSCCQPRSPQDKLELGEATLTKLLPTIMQKEARSSNPNFLQISFVAYYLHSKRS